MGNPRSPRPRLKTNSESVLFLLDGHYLDGHYLDGHYRGWHGRTFPRLLRDVHDKHDAGNDAALRRWRDLHTSGLKSREMVKRLGRMLRDAGEIPQFLKDLTELKRQQKASSVSFPFGELYPCLDDRHDAAGGAKGHYFHQDLLVARRICASAPRLHVDVGSRVDGFVAHVAAFREIEVFDVRPMTANIPNVRFRQADLMAPLAGDLVDYCDSLSCLHALEHFGLGRYGDTVDFEGHLKGLSNLKKLVAPGGKFYLSVPIGPQRIEFNAHRVFSVSTLLSLVDGFRVDAFSYVDDRGDLHENAALMNEFVTTNFGCKYGCGILELTKL